MLTTNFGPEAVADKPTQLQRQQREEALQENRRELKLIKDDRNRVRLERDLKRTAARVKAGYCTCPPPSLLPFSELLLGRRSNHPGPT